MGHKFDIQGLLIENNKLKKENLELREENMKLKNRLMEPKCVLPTQEELEG